MDSMGKRGPVGWSESSAWERKDIYLVKNWLYDNLKLDFISDSSDLQQKEQDIDLVAERGRRKILIEVKIRYKDYGDFLLETQSNTQTHSPGWVYVTDAELLAYIVIERRAVSKGYVLNVGELRRWWIKEGIYMGFSVKMGKTDNLYETLNHAIPWKKIPLNAFVYTPSYDYVKEYFDGQDWEK